MCVLAFLQYVCCRKMYDAVGAIRPARSKTYYFRASISFLVPPAIAIAIVHRSVQAVRSTTALPPRGISHRDLEKRSGMAVPLLHQPSAANNAQFVAADRSGLGHLKPSLRSVITEHTAGDRRLQDACDTQITAFALCLPSTECANCYDSAIDAATSDFVFCLELENNLCAISASSSCSSCGCETEAVDYYQCIVNEQSCPEIINCADVACDAVYNDAVSCVKTVGTSCLSCAADAVATLDESLSCPDREDALCPAFHENCGCDQCADKVESWVACLYTQSLVCANFACSAPETPSPAANSSSGGSGSQAVIWAVVAIVVVIIIIAATVTVYLVRRKRPNHDPTSNKDASTSSAPMNEYSETTSTAPLANHLQHAHSPPPQQRHQTPVTASRQSDDDYRYDGRRPTDEEGSAASPNYPSSLQSTGGRQLLVNKDQCRSVAPEVEIPVAIIVEEVNLPQSDPYGGKRGSEP